MEDTNLPKGCVKVVWEILPGEGQHVFREMTPEDIDPGLLQAGLPIDTANFPMIPHPLLNPEQDCPDRVWEDSIIKIGYKPSDWNDDIG